MSTYTIYASAADGTIWSTDTATYADARSGASGLSVSTTASPVNVGQGWQAGPLYTCAEAFWSFDCTGIADTATITSATIMGKWTPAGSGYDIEARLHDWGTTVTTSDWVAGADLGSKTLLASRLVTELSSGSPVALNSDAALLNYVSPSGILRVVICSSKHRDGTAPTASEHTIVSMSEAGLTVNDPRLIVVTNESGSLGDVATGTNKSAGTTLAMTNNTGSAIDIGNLLVILFAMDPTAGTVSAADNATAGGTANTYTVRKDYTNGSAGSGVRVVVLTSILTRAIPNLFTVTVTHPSVTARAGAVTLVGIGTTTSISVETSGDAGGTSATPSASASNTTPDALIIAALGIEGPSGDTFTEDTDGGWTAVAGTGTTGGSANTNISIRGAIKIVTAAATHTYNPGITSRIWADTVTVIPLDAVTSPRAMIATINEGVDAYHLVLDYDPDTGAAQRVALEPVAHPGTKTATASVTLDDDSVLTLTAVPPGTDTDGHAYLDLTGETITVGSDSEGPTFTGIKDFSLEVSA